MIGSELEHLMTVLKGESFAGDGEFTRRCNDYLTRTVGGAGALITHSCTGALEMAAILSDLKAGDEVVLPSYTFVSTANAVVLRGATPVFVDIQPNTLNIDPAAVADAVNEKTKAICVVHYAGVPADMDPINAIAAANDLKVIEDAAQAFGSEYKGRPCGNLGDLGCFSFHETKNVLSGEGGALICKSQADLDRAQIVWEKGTNRKQFFQGLVDKYTWVDIGSSYLPSEIIAAFLFGQLERHNDITEKRRSIYQNYKTRLAALEAKGDITLPSPPNYGKHNGHLFYILTNDANTRAKLIEHLRGAGVYAPFHYIPLHSSPAGKEYGRAHGALDVTDSVSARIVRMPLYYTMSEGELDNVVGAVNAFYVA